MDEDEARRAQLQRDAGQVAHELVGLPVEQASAVVATHPGLSIRFAPEGGVVTSDLRFGRITATVRDDVVVEAHAG